MAGLLVIEARNLESLGREDGFKAGVILLAGIREQPVAIFRPILDFFQCILHAQLNHILRIGTTPGQALEQFMLGSGHDKEIHERGTDGGLSAGAHLICPLDIDIHDHIRAGCEMVDDFGFECAVAITMNFGMFNELIVGNLLLKCLRAQEVVVVAVTFTFTCRAGGAGGGVNGFPLIGKASAESGFARAGWP